MTWLYTILFSGLLFASQPGAVARPAISSPQVEVSESRSGDITERLDKSYPLTAEGQVSISNTNGRIELEAWDKEEAALVVEKTGPSKEILDSVKVLIDSDNNRFRLRTENQDWSRGGTDAKKQVKVVIKMKLPRRAVLGEIESVNGDITIAGFANSVEVSLVNGGVTLSGLQGRLVASTVNGPITADYDRLESQTRIKLSSVNGPLKLNIPTDSDATLKCETLNGGISTDFGLQVKKANFVGHSLHSRLGAGATDIELESVNGPLFIGHPNDGRSPAPAVNLLTESGDDEAIAIRPPRVDVGKVPAEAQRAIAEAKRRSAEAVKAALQTAQDESVRAAIATGPIVDRSVKAALDSAREQIKAADIGKAAAKEARRALRLASKDWRFVNGFGNERVFGVDPAVKRRSKSFPVSGMPNVTIEAPGCSVHIVGTDEPTVRYTLTAIRPSGDKSPVEVEDSADSNSVQIKVFGDPDETWRTRLDVFVPKKANLKVTSDGELRIEGVSGSLDLKGDDSSITLYDSSGKLSAASAAGRIRVVGFRGDVNASTESGTVDLDGDFDHLIALSDLGDILVTVPANFSGKINTIENNVQFDGLSPVRIGGDDEEPVIYKIGEGRHSYSVQTDGNIMVRSLDSVMGRK